MRKTIPQADSSMAPEVEAVFRESGMDPEKARHNRHAVDLVLSWRAVYIQRPTLINALRSLLADYPGLARRVIRRKRLTGTGQRFIG